MQTGVLEGYHVPNRFWLTTLPRLD